MECDGSSSKLLQLPECTFMAARFAQDIFSGGGNLVGPDNQPGMYLADSACLACRKSPHEFVWRFIRQRRLVDIRCGSREGYSQSLQQFPAKWGGGCKYQGRVVTHRRG
jgi:hypothetical protein